MFKFQIRFSLSYLHLHIVKPCLSKGLEIKWMGVCMCKYLKQNTSYSIQFGQKPFTRNLRNITISCYWFLLCCWKTKLVFYYSISFELFVSNLCLFIFLTLDDPGSLVLLHLNISTKF